MSGLPAGRPKAYISENYTSELHAVFAVGWTHPIKIDCNQIGPMWGVGLAGSACRVKGVKMVR